MYQNVYQGYVDNEILNADPMRLIVLMYRGALDAVSAARGALASGDIRVRSAKITKAIDILNELALSLDHSKAPDLCRNLVELYDYMNRRLIEGNNQQTDAPLVHWAVWDAMFRAQNALEGVLSNYPSRIVAWCLRRIVFPLGRPYVVPSDRLGGQVADLLIAPSETRDRLTAGMYVPRDAQDPVGVIELALEATLQAEAVQAKLRAAQKAGKLSGRSAQEIESQALAAGVITTAEHALLVRARELTGEVIKVDDFPFDLGLQRSEPVPAPHRVAA